MPIYTYRCESCGHEDEILVANIKQARNITCAVCLARMKRIMSTANFVVKPPNAKTGYK